MSRVDILEAVDPMSHNQRPDAILPQLTGAKYVLVFFLENLIWLVFALIVKIDNPLSSI